MKWWMWHFGGATAKRHFAFSNSPAISKLDRGRLTGWKKLPPQKQTARHYRDRKGRRRYQGTSQLKKTEFLDISTLKATSLDLMTVVLDCIFINDESFN